MQEVSLASSLEQTALHHLLTDGFSAVNGCRQNESPNRNPNNPQVIHTMSFKPLFSSSIYNIALSCEK